jgi:ribosome-associated toxin RatA of RatAB toxin-antitoxin module
MIRKILKITALTLATIIVGLLMYGFVQYPNAKGVQHFTTERIINAPKDKVWKIISDVGNYHKVTSAGIDDVEIIEGDGLGMKRVCSDPNGNSWEETCTLWKPGEEFRFEVNTEKEDYPYPLKSLSGSWKVDPVSPMLTKLSLDFTYEFKNAFLSGYFLSMGQEQALEDTQILFDNWQKMAESKN